uniref:Innexin n=1 Tax=Plectus sambesii TaxID=2011161 RepID=A0A914V8R4_9BILA
MGNPFDAISSVNGLIGRFFRQPNGDFADRLSARLTVSILTILAAILLSTHYWGEPITCWAPAQFTKQWVDFVNYYCYVHGTYFVPMNKPLAWDEDMRRQVPINYYQWVPYVFGLQALLFYLPRFFWRCLCGVCGVDLAGIVRHVDAVWIKVQADQPSFQGRQEKFEKFAAPFVWDSIRLYRTRSGFSSRLLPMCYVAANVVQAGNAWIQWWWLNRFLQSHSYALWGIGIIADLFSGIDWQFSGHFPRITHCDFSHRRPASVQLDTVLCVLTLNVYYEKIFLFLWFWMAFVGVVCAANAIFWAHSLCFHQATVRLVRKYMKSTDPSDAEEARSPVQDVLVDERQVDRYLELLGTDGLFILSHIAINVGHLPASYLARAMCNVSTEWYPTMPRRVKAVGSSSYLITSSAQETSPILGRKGAKEV